MIFALKLIKKNSNWSLSELPDRQSLLQQSDSEWQAFHIIAHRDKKKLIFQTPDFHPISFYSNSIKESQKKGRKTHRRTLFVRFSVCVARR